MKIKYKNYEVITIHKSGKRTGGGFDFLAEAVEYFEKSKTAIKIVIMQATHNNTRLKTIRNLKK